MSIILGDHQYGKAENRVVRIYRDSPRHEIHDVNVSTALRGDFEAAHLEGDQSAVLPTGVVLRVDAAGTTIATGPKARREGLVARRVLKRVRRVVRRVARRVPPLRRAVSAVRSLIG